MIRVLNVFDLMNAGRFVRHQACDNLKYPDASSITVLFSHRWETLEDPDPSRLQFHGAVRFAITACMMACGSTPNVFNEVDFSEIILCPKLFARLGEECRSLTASLRTPVGVKAFAADTDLQAKSGLLARYLFETIGDENATRVVSHLPMIAWLMRKIDFWYDFSCMPQQPRSQPEQAAFENELDDLHRHFSRYSTCIHWSTSSLKRAWCFLEGAISLESGTPSVFCTENSLISSHKPATIHEEHFGDTVFGPSESPLEFREVGNNSYRLYRRVQEREDLTTDLSYRLNNDVRVAASALRGKNMHEILEYLKTNEYSTTQEEDMERVAKSLSRYFGPPATRRRTNR